MNAEFPSSISRSTTVITKGLPHATLIVGCLALGLAVAALAIALYAWLRPQKIVLSPDDKSSLLQFIAQMALDSDGNLQATGFHDANRTFSLRSGAVTAAQHLVGGLTNPDTIKLDAKGLSQSSSTGSTVISANGAQYENKVSKAISSGTGFTVANPSNTQSVKVAFDGITLSGQSTPDLAVAAGVLRATLPLGVATIRSQTAGQLPALTDASGSQLKAFNETSGAGFQYLSNGLILQWGRTNGRDPITNDPVDVTSVSFPIPFPQHVFSITATINHSDPQTADGKRSANVTAATLTGFNVWTGEGDVANISFPTFWMAIGA